MTDITVRAPDSQQAMDEVLRRLGANAFILSTAHVDGLVEIRASADLPPPAFADTLRAEIARAPRATAATLVADGDLAALGHRLFVPASATATDATRLVIVGPPGAGKSMLAARLAARRLLADRTARPRLISPIPGRRLVDDRLRGWARLMGLAVDHPPISTVADLPPDPHRPQIIDLSDVPGPAPDLATRLIDADDAELILTLPTGLHPAMIRRLCAMWQPYHPTVCLTRLDHWEPEPDELTTIADQGLKLTRIASGTGLLNSIRHPGLADLRHWVSGWPVSQAQAAE
jgi:hypothetical protein